MNPPLQVLIVEDSEDDMLLMLRELRRGGYTLDSVRVETSEQMQAELDRQPWDLVIADYTLPDFSAIDALKLVRAQHQDWPFIIVSGTITEETAVAAMKAGAHDYITKSNLARLLPAIERELREAEDRQKRHRAEQALRESEERFRQLAENIVESVFWISDPQSAQLLYVSPAYEHIWGRSCESLYVNCMEWQDAIHPEDQQRVRTNFLAQALTGRYDEEYRIIRPDGSMRWIRDRGFPIRNASGDPYRVVGIAEDITPRKHSEQKIREQAALLDIASDAIFVRDLEHRILYWNQGAERLYGWLSAEAVGRKASELLQEDTAETSNILQIALDQGEWRGELRKVTKAGKTVIVEGRWTLVRDEAGRPKSILSVNTDITEKKQLEAQFLRAQRLESLGTLASGIAHDLNNILTPILAIAPLLPLDLPPLSKSSRQLLEMLDESAKRAADLVKQILTFARGLEGERAPVQIKHLLRELDQMMHSTFPKSITATCNSASSDLWLVSANATQLQQVFMNLCVNARDAMPQGGILSIVAENKRIDETDVRLNLGAKVGPYVAIAFTDTGTGISPEHIDRIFDPFFTTKAVGEGTGLGLSSAMGIVKNHGGFITVHSEVGQGTQFQVCLPAIANIETPSAKSRDLPLGRGELILVADDEANIRKTLKMTLENQNYKVLTANDGLEAISTYTAHQTDIKAVLMDIMMPSMGGDSAIRALQQCNPQVKVIVCSGVATRETLPQTLGIKAFLSKPFTADDLLHTLHSVLKGD
ncbi:MAG: PAS domain S-box protein [Thermosynechococcaceae cyanobacterium]